MTRFLRVMFGWNEIHPDEPTRKGGMMRDLITSGIRTSVQVAVAAIVGWATNAGFEIDAVSLELALFSIVTGVVTVALNWASRKWPIVGKILSLGLTANTPSY